MQEIVVLFTFCHCEGACLWRATEAISGSAIFEIPACRQAGLRPPAFAGVLVMTKCK